MSDVLDRLKSALADRYSIERELGSGGMAVVYLGRDLRHERDVAVKVLRAEFAAAMGADRFLREIKLTAKLNHPHILPLHDSGEAVGFLYYVMPYVAGESLRQRLERETQLPVDEALRITQQVASALDFAHRQDVIHRDIKPENVLLHEGEAMVADFGIALAVSAAGGERLTETGVSVGTVEYMSPEQALGEGEPDARSDVYSLGCVLYEMLVGEPPYTGPTAMAVLAKRLSDPVPRARRLRAAIPEALDAVLVRALAKERVDRFGSAREFAAALVAEAAEDVEAVKSIVVLPFANLSPDPEQEYFSDGLTEEVIAALSKIHALRVISRTSAMRLKDAEKNLKTIAAELKVHYVLEGSVRKAGENIRITAQLIDAVDDAHVWADTYDGTVTDVFDIQEQVARAISGALRIKLSPEESEEVSSRPISDVHAHECLLRARREIWRFTNESTAQALEYLREALQIVGDNAQLYEGMAQAHYIRSHTCVEEAEAELERMAECAEKAIALNPDSSFAHCCLGLVAWKETGRQLEAVRQIKHAFDLNPNDMMTAHWLSFHAACVGRPEIARRAAARHLEIDPLTVEAQWGMGFTHCMEGRFTRALEYYERAHHLDPASMNVRVLVVHGLMLNQRFEEACDVAEGMERDAPEATATWPARFLKHAMLGDKAKALESVTEDLEAAARYDEVAPYWLAEGYALLGEKNPALDWLEHAVSRGFLSYPYLAEYAPFFGNIRGEPRFKRLMERVRHEWEAFEV